MVSAAPRWRPGGRRWDRSCSPLRWPAAGPGRPAWAARPAPAPRPPPAPGPAGDPARRRPPPPRSAPARTSPRSAAAPPARPRPVPAPAPALPHQRRAPPPCATPCAGPRRSSSPPRPAPFLTLMPDGTAAGMPYYRSVSVAPLMSHATARPGRPARRSKARPSPAGSGYESQAHRTSRRYDPGRNACTESAIRRIGYASGSVSG